MSSTLQGLYRYEEEIKKSRFQVVAAPVGAPSEAMDFFVQNSVATATHNCWAYRIGEQYRFNDDGEPGGTAGRPILQAIEGQSCDRVAVLVIRWFGGIKLGAGGLIRAYGGAAAQCLRLAPKIELVDEVQLDCRCQFSDVALVQSRFSGFHAVVVAEEFDAEGVRWRLRLPRSHHEAFAQQFTNLTRGQGGLETVE